MVLDMVDGATLHQLVRGTLQSPKLYDVQIGTDSGDSVTTYFECAKIKWRTAACC